MDTLQKQALDYAFICARINALTTRALMTKLTEAEKAEREGLEELASAIYDDYVLRRR